MLPPSQSPVVLLAPLRKAALSNRRRSRYVGTAQHSPAPQVLQTHKPGCPKGGPSHNKNRMLRVTLQTAAGYPSTAAGYPLNRRRLPLNRRRLPLNRRRLPPNRRRLPLNRRRLPSNRRRLPPTAAGYPQPPPVTPQPPPVTPFPPPVTPQRGAVHNPLSLRVRGRPCAHATHRIVATEFRPRGGTGPVPSPRRSLAQ